MGLRRKGLTRYRRGGKSDVVALPALFADIDRHSLDTLAGLRGFSLKPSCIVDSGGGLHAYWWLDPPTTELDRAGRILKVLADELQSDSLSVAQSLRLPGSINTKSGRNNAPCYIVDLTDRAYMLNDFEQWLSIDDCSAQNVEKLYTTLQTVHSVHRAVHVHSTRRLNPEVIQAVSDRLIAMGYVKRGDWLCGACLYPSRHKHDDLHHSFGFNVKSGYGHCYRCGSMLAKDIKDTLSIWSIT